VCGFGGIVAPGPLERSALEAMSAALAHRGPDDASLHVEAGFGVGFRRLSIIDVEGGRQPIANEDGSVLVVLNGEIYNHDELRRSLLRRGHRFATRADTEVLVHLYEEVGSELVHRLRGMFAFALWDRARGRLLLGRDHLGQKPLYWARSRGRFLFASEIKGILAAAPELAELDPLALHEYLTLRVVSSPRSMFAGIRKLPEAHVMEVGADGEPAAPRRYWSLRYEPKQEVAEAEALERLDAELRRTVALHLVSDVEVGAFLSGGLDSGLIVALMSAVGGAGFKTFSAGTPYGAFDEREAARAVATRYGTQHVEIVVDGDVLGDLPTLVHHLDEPSDPLGAAVYALAGRAAREVKVVLGGDGGDELFGGYDRYVGLRWAHAYARVPSRLRRGVLRRLVELAPDAFWYKSLAHKLRWLQELAAVEPERRYARSLGYAYFTPALRAPLYTERFRRLVDGFDAESDVMAWQTHEGVKEALDGMLLADSMVRLPNHPVMVLDRMSMAHGLEARSPFLDHELAQLVATLPVHLKVRGRRRRYLETRLAARYLPAEALRRPKQGFASALPYLMDGAFRALFRRFLPESALVETGLLERGAVRGLLEDHLSGRRDHGSRLWLLLNAELWYRMRILGQELGALEDAVAAELSGSRSARGPSSTSRSPPCP
jgi:asparagine synthase (glutamine-hydrolysing)